MPALPLLFSLTNPGELAAPRPLSARDLWAIERVSSPQLSPDGKSVVFQRTSFDAVVGSRKANLWTVSLSEGALRPLTQQGSDGDAVWLGDSIWFLSGRSGTQQVWRIDPNGGEALAVTSLPLDVGAFRVTPDGTRLVVTLSVFPDAPDPAATASRLADRATRKDSAFLHERGYVRHWDTFNDGRRNQLFVIPVVGGDPIHLSAGADGDTPTRPHGGAEDFVVTPGGSGVLWLSQPPVNEPWTTARDLWYAPIDGSVAPVRVLQHPAEVSSPTFSPNGRSLAILRREVPGFESDRNRIVLFPWTGSGLGAATVLTEHWDRSPGNLSWFDDKHLLVSADDLGRTPLFRISSQTAVVETLVSTGTSSAAATDGNRIVFVHDTLESPPELALWRNGKTNRLTSIGQSTTSPHRFGASEPFTFVGAHGETVHGWWVKPANFDASKTYPVAFVVHGGPQGSSGDHWHWRWNAQVFAGAGYAVVFVDFHGSTGYGQAFTDSISGDWGGAPLEDLQLGLQAVLEKNPWMDADRVAALGASYGGYMMNWIAGNWPDRFRCLVNHDGVFSPRTLYFETEELFFPEHEFGGTPWEVPEAYDRFDPSRFVGQWKTPTLVVTGRKDYRVPEVQALATYTALQRRNIPSQLLVIDGANHWVTHGPDALVWWDTVLAWVDRWTAPGPPIAR